MKQKLFLYAAILMASAGLTISSCSSSSDDKTEPVLKLNVSNPVALEAGGGTYSVSVEASADWTAAPGTTSWLTVQTGKTSISLSASANESGVSRTETVTVRLTGYEKSQAFTVTQEPKPEEFRLFVSPAIINTTYQGGDYTLTVDHTDNVSWVYEIDSQGEGWVSEKSKTAGEVVLTISGNEGLERSSDVTFRDPAEKTPDVVLKITQAAGPNSNDPTAKGYALVASMQGAVGMVGQDYSSINTYMKTYGFDYSEHPNSSQNDHPDGVHCQNVYDETLQQYVFKFISHIDGHLDGDRGTPNDRQRNEMKSRASSSQYFQMNGNWDEWQVLEWKFKLPKGFQPSNSFTHIHQLKAYEGSNNGSALITLTPRSNSNGSNKRMQVIHTGNTDETKKGYIVDNVALEEFEDEWVQVQQETHFTYNGYYSIKITRIRDQKVLIDCTVENIDMWRSGAINIRNKFGIYRSFGGKVDGENWRPTNGIKDEDILLGDFKVYEKNTNPNPKAID